MRPRQEIQEEMQQSIEKTLIETGDLEEGQVLTGWIVCFETASISDNRASCGHLYGPSHFTTWRALGILEWVRRFSLRPDEDDDAEDA